MVMAARGVDSQAWTSTAGLTGIMTGITTGINIPLHWVLLCHFTNLFITSSYQDNFVYSFVIQSNFVYTSQS